MWKDAANNGLILGAILTAIIAVTIAARLDLSMPYAGSAAQYAFMIVLLMKFCKTRGAKYGKAGFNYAQNMNFILATMLFTGAIVGIMTFIFQQYIVPDYYREVINQALEQNPQNIDQQSIDMAMGIMKNPFIMVLSSMFGMLINGGFVGIFTSIFTRIPAQIDAPEAEVEADENTEENN